MTQEENDSDPNGSTEKERALLTSSAVLNLMISATVARGTTKCGDFILEDSL